MRKLFALLALAGACFPMPSCALIFTGTTDTVRVTTEPPGQEVKIDGGRYRAPIILELESGRNHMVIGPDGAARNISTHFDPIAILNFLFVLPWVIDLASGAAYRLSPTEVHFSTGNDQAGGDTEGSGTR